MIEIYTDGSALGNPGPGGWAAVIIGMDGQSVGLEGGAIHTTNNRMELIAVIEALRALPAGSKATVYTDSTYVVGATMPGGLLSKDFSRRPNADLWCLLQAQRVRHDHIKFKWVRGHDGNTYNDIADTKARQQSALFKMKGRPNDKAQ